MAAEISVLPSGRRIGLSAFGDPIADRLVLLCHPTPGTSGFDPDPITTERWGVHLLASDRPGYGSTPPDADGDHPLTRWVDDMAASISADESNADRISNADLHHCGVIGWGTGAVVAAAFAARHPGLVDRLALVSPRAPFEPPAGTPTDIVSARTTLGVQAHDPAFARHLGLDRRLDRMLEDAFLQGDSGVRGDRLLFGDVDGTSGFDRITAPTLVLSGADDPACDRDELRRWRRRLPRGARFQTVRDSAALTIADAWDQVLAHVAPAHGHIAAELRDHGRPVLPEV